MTNHHQILTLARAGNPARAWAVFEGRGLPDITDDPKVLTLKGRLCKDRARLALREERGADAAMLYAQASEAYLAAHALRADSYPLINAAALAFFAGDEARSHQLAREVLDLLASDPNEGENAYWRAATQAEALLLLGQRAEAETALAAGIAQLPRAWQDHAATLGQFEQIIAAQDGNAGWLDVYRPPCILHFSGMIGLDPDNPQLEAAIDTALANLNPGFAYGALAAGADILIAEKLVAGGVQLSVTLPAPVEQFRQVSVEAYGGDWPARFDRLIEQAREVDILPSTIAGDDLPLAGTVEMASLSAMGQAIRRAEVLKTRAVALTIAAPGEVERGPITTWRSAGLDVHVIESARVSGPNGQTGSDAAASSLEVSAILAVTGEQDGLEALAERHGMKFLPAMEGSILVSPIEQGLAAIRALRAEAGSTSCGVLVELADRAAPDADQMQRALRMAQAAPDGTSYADRHSAMIAKVMDPDVRVEEMGELSSLQGPVSVWSLHG